MVRKRKQDFSSYVGDVLQNSMLTGIPQIAAAGNWPKKIVRSLVFCMCVGGFVYQSLTFMWLYWEYEVVVDVRVSNPSFVERPSMTICASNGFKALEFCEDPDADTLREEHKIRCKNVKINQYYYDWCNCNPRLCDRKGNLRNLTYLVDYHKVYNLPREDIRKYLLTPKEILWSCTDHKMRETGDLADCQNDYIPEIPCQFEVEFPEVCFTLNSLIGRPNHTVEKVFTDAEIRLYLGTNDDLIPTIEKRNTLHISIHNPYQVENPFTSGFVMIAGKYYTYRMKKVVTKLLPYPYSTDCMDYRAMWKARGGRGPTNLKECILECQKNISMEKHGCLLSTIYIPSDEMRCQYDFSDLTLYKAATECAQKNCRPACDEEYYVVTQDSGEDGYVNCYKDNFKELPNSAYVFIRLDGMETTSYIYSPKYQDIETFSYLGGYVGMWLGISLVAVFDFVETLFVMMKYPMRRFLYYKERRKRLNAVQQIQRSL